MVGRGTACARGAGGADHPTRLRAQRSVVDGRAFFDAAFFDISPRDAEFMDPQGRLLLQHAWQALEDAGYRPEDVPGPASPRPPARTSTRCSRSDGERVGPAGPGELGDVRRMAVRPGRHGAHHDLHEAGPAWPQHGGQHQLLLGAERGVRRRSGTSGRRRGPGDRRRGQRSPGGTGIRAPAGPELLERPAQSRVRRAADGMPAARASASSCSSAPARRSPPATTSTL